MLSKRFFETNVNLVIECEQYKKLHREVWIADENSKAAIWNCRGRAIQNAKKKPEDGFVRAKIGGIAVMQRRASH